MMIICIRTYNWWHVANGTDTQFRWMLDAWARFIVATGAIYDLNVASNAISIKQTKRIWISLRRRRRRRWHRVNGRQAGELIAITYFNYLQQNDSFITVAICIRPWCERYLLHLVISLNYCDLGAVCNHPFGFSHRSSFTVTI